MVESAVRSAALLAVALLLGACTEKPQTISASGRKADTPAWAKSDAAVPGFAAKDWKGGDQAAWDAQIRTRNQAQNDYAR